MFKDHVAFLTDEQYRSVDAFSYSFGKAIDEKGPLAFIDIEDKKSKALEFGTLVDTLLTSPDSIHEKFHTHQIEKPTASLLALCDALLLDHIAMDYTYEQLIDDEYVTNKIHSLDLWSTTKDPNKLKDKWQVDLFYEYIRESILAQGKTIVTPEILESAENAANVLRSHDYTAKYFHEDEDTEVVMQACIFYVFKGVHCKAKPDLIQINHKEKRIKPIDIKTGSELPSKFENSFYYFQYYLQVIPYLLAIQSITEKIPEFKDYQIDPFMFMYISKKMPETPVLWEVPNNDVLLNKFFDGWDDHTGFNKLIDDYKFYKDNSIYNVERVIGENNGLMKITLK
jgi:hypothetical protein